MPSFSVRSSYAFLPTVATTQGPSSAPGWPLLTLYTPHCMQACPFGIIAFPTTKMLAGTLRSCRNLCRHYAMHWQISELVSHRSIILQRKSFCLDAHWWIYKVAVLHTQGPTALGPHWHLCLHTYHRLCLAFTTLLLGEPLIPRVSLCH